MTEEPKATEEEPKICTVDGLRKICETHPKLLLISASKERKNFLQKFVNEAVPTDTSVASFDTDGSCETLEKLGMKNTCKAILYEKGKVKREIILQNDDNKDSIALMKMIYEKGEEPECEPCKTELIINKRGWKMKLEANKQCSQTLADIDKLRPDVRKYLEKHISDVETHDNPIIGSHCKE